MQKGKAGVRPKSTTRPKSTVSNRPYSISKDEAFARSLQDEEYTATVDEDEEFARQLQNDMNFEERRKMQSSLAPGRPGLRSMTPISQLVSNLMHTRLDLSGQGERPFPSLGMRSHFTPPNMSSDSSSTSDSDSDNDITNPTFSTLSRNMNADPTTISQSRSRGTRRTSRGHHGVRPTETSVHSSDSLTSTTGPGGVPRPAVGTRGRGRGTRRGTTGARRGSRVTNNQSETSVGGATGERRVEPATMEPSGLPLSLAMNQPELPNGEMEPEMLILDHGMGASGHDDGFLHIMRDPMLLLLFMMGRTPHLLVPDDIDPTDYEALWDLAERLGEVKNKGLNEKELKSLPSKIHHSKSKSKGEKEEQDQCQVCLTAYKAGDRTCSLACKHEFHHNCIKEWLKRNATCPICRHEIKGAAK